MTSNIEKMLQDAFDLIEADRLEQARALLRPILETDKNNPDVWWIYAHAVNDPESARLALLKVLSLDSNYPGAQALLTALEQQKISGQELTDEELASEPPFVPVLPDSLPDMSGSHAVTNKRNGATAIEEQDEIDYEPESRSLLQQPIVYIPLLILLIAAALVVVVLRPFQNTSPDVATQTANGVAPVSTEVSVAVPEEINGSAGSVSEDILVRAVIDGMSSFTFPDSPVQIVRTSLGSTLVVSVCTKAGLELRTDLPRAILAIVQATNDFVGQFDAVAARMVDCDSNTELRTIGVMRSDVIDFVTGTLDQAQFEARWVPIVL